MANKFEELYENITDGYELMAAAYYMIHSNRPYDVDDVNFIAEAFDEAIKGDLEVDIKEVLRARGLMTEDGEIVEE